MTTNNDKICDAQMQRPPIRAYQFGKTSPRLLGLLQQNGYLYVSMDSTMKKGKSSHRFIAISKTIHIGLDAGIAR